MGAQKFTMGYVTLTFYVLGLDIAYLCTKFDHSSFTPSRDKIAVHQNLNDSRDLTTPLLRMICHLWARTCYNQPAYQIRSFYLCSL